MGLKGITKHYSRSLARWDTNTVAVSLRSDYSHRICAPKWAVMWQLRMSRFFSILLMAVLCGCTSTNFKEEELKFSYQDNYDFFGYVTHWVRNPDIPPTSNNIDGAEKDFALCKSKIKEHFIAAQVPSRDIQYAFIVECMYKNGWFLSAESYMVTQ